MELTEQDKLVIKALWITNDNLEEVFYDMACDCWFGKDWVVKIPVSNKEREIIKQE